MAFSGESQFKPIDRVNLAFHQSRYPAIRNLGVRADGEKLVIVGEVPSFYLKQLAQAIARHVEGVRHIENRVVVRTDSGTRTGLRSASSEDRVLRSTR